MSKGSSNQDAAIKLQKESLAQSSAANTQMLALLKSQQDNAKSLKLPKAASPQPLPDTSRADMVAQLQEQRRNLMQRSGLMQTRVVPTAPIRTALGTPMFA